MSYNSLRFLFSTSESDSETIYRDANGNFFSKRYGLPVMPIKREWAESQAWFEANRKGQFSHLLYYKEGQSIPSLSNPEAQKFIVSVKLNDVILKP